MIWAVKPQTFKDAAAAVAAHNTGALHLSVAAGIPSSSIAAWLGSERIIRTMPNTPALIGKGITGLYARAGVSQADRQAVEQVGGLDEGFFMYSEELDWCRRIKQATAPSGSSWRVVFLPGAADVTLKLLLLVSV